MAEQIAAHGAEVAPGRVQRGRAALGGRSAGHVAYRVEGKGGDAGHPAGQRTVSGLAATANSALICEAAMSLAHVAYRPACPSTSDPREAADRPSGGSVRGLFIGAAIGRGLS